MYSRHVWFSHIAWSVDGPGPLRQIQSAPQDVIERLQVRLASRGQETDSHVSISSPSLMGFIDWLASFEKTGVEAIQNVSRSGLVRGAEFDFVNPRERQEA